MQNEQMADICRRPPVVLADLGQISGIGKGRLEKYGGAIITAVNEIKRDQSHG